MQRVIITGATSMIGTALIKECVKNNINVLAVVRRGTEKLERLPKSEKIEVLECDLEQFGSVKKRDETYDVFYHMAWAYTSKEYRDNPCLQEKNIRYTLHAAELAARLGCRKFIGAGSQAEYGPKNGVITPDTETDPQLSYGMAKYAAGMLSRKLCRQYGMVHIWGRIFSVYGKNDNEGSMLIYAIDQFLQGQPAEFSLATQMWDYLYEDDVGRIFYLLGQYIEKNKVYCVANGNYRPLRDYILEMQEVYGEGAECRFGAGSGEKPLGLQPDVSSLQNDIAYQPCIEFEEGIRKVIQYRKKIFTGSID